jgi:NAD(P)H dehydrogenase (quinone)
LRRGRSAAAAISAVTGRRIEYTDLPADVFTRVLLDAGVPAELAHVLADADRAMSRDEMFTDSGDLRRLIGRPTATPAEAIAAALQYGPAPRRDDGRQATGAAPSTASSAAS